MIPLLFAVQVLLVFSFALMAYLTLTDRLPPNRYFGIRTKRTRSSPEVWRQVHRGFFPFALAIAFVALVGLVPMALTADSGPGLFIALWVADGLIVVLALVGTVVAQRGVGKA
ncbi:SdpI family protein [Actinokineospora guangxiensis]|uniref:SdpI family protein n=1 Tax=Actinokineospora guangxiensis TaxID=1490288 RepID=A0ABW0ETE6_9PSEU